MVSQGSRSSSGGRGRFVPTAMTPRAYGFRRRPYTPADVPTSLVSRGIGLSAQQFRQQFAYEWLLSEEISRGLSNPPFTKGAAGRLLPSLQDEGQPARILRGFIRRSNIETGENRDQSRCRLYFMYNPEIITRDYVSYLDQTALDPFNTVYDSGNLVAPPSILDFSFSLFFDRQEEAVDPENFGVFADYQYFDLVVRNVVPTDPNSTDAIPDSGVMMVNPREITVVFSPQITVQGRPLNARVSFLKFTHRMVPTRMQIDLTIRATYLGPLRPTGTYTAEEYKVTDAVPLGAALPQTSVTYTESDAGLSRIYEQAERFSNGDLLAYAQQYGEQAGFTDISGSVGTSLSHLTTAGRNAREAALNFALSSVVEGVTQYNSAWDKRGAPMIDYGGKRIFDMVDCSSLVTRCYMNIGAGHAMGWGQDRANSPSTETIMGQINAGTFPGEVIPWSAVVSNPDILKPGDIGFRRRNGKGHIGFVVEKTSNSAYTLLDAASQSSNPQVGLRTGRGIANATWTHLLRPNPSNWTSQAGNSNEPL